MSRHRNVRNLDIDEVLDEDEFVDDYDENELDETQLSNEDLDNLEEGLSYIYSVVGENVPVSATEIKEALWYYYFDREETVNWVLEKIAKYEAEEKKQKAKQAKKNAAQAHPAETDKKKATKSTSRAPAKVNDTDSSRDQLSEDMQALGLGSAKSTKTETVANGASPSDQAAPSVIQKPVEPLAKIPASKRINVLEEYAKRSMGKPLTTICIIGHVDSGKSTIVGHLMYQLGEINHRTMHKYERDSQKIGKGSFAFAWVMDETEEERARGITMDIATNGFETEHHKFTVLDAPGHRDFIPNMISGTAQADAAVLVADATTGSFEAGFDAHGQTKEHALLARSLGVQQLVIAVNKLDAMNWDQARFEEIVQRLTAFLVQAGFRKNKLTFVPVSGLTGENLTSRSTMAELTAWYKGPSLLEAIDAFETPTRLVDRPFRMGVTDFFKGGIGSSGGVSVAGSIDSGHLQVGEQVMVVPGNEIGAVKAMQVNDEVVNWGVAGDSILMTLSNLDILNLSNGCVLCSPQHPVPVTSSFIAQIVVFDIKVPITSGFSVVLHHQSADEPAIISKLLMTLDKSTGEMIKKNPRHLSKGATAKVRINMPLRPIPLETFKDNKNLGRVMLRREGETVAAGIVTEILSFGS